MLRLYHITNFPSTDKTGQILLFHPHFISWYEFPWVREIGYSEHLNNLSEKQTAFSCEGRDFAITAPSSSAAVCNHKKTAAQKSAAVLCFRNFNPGAEILEMPWNYKDIRHRQQTIAENHKSGSAPAKPLPYADKNKEPLLFREAVIWSEWQDLNLRPLPPQGSALPICATPSCFQRVILYHRKTTLSIPFLKKIFYSI